MRISQPDAHRTVIIFASANRISDHLQIVNVITPNQVMLTQNRNTNPDIRGLDIPQGVKV